jgi:activator of HSP90 ATPase
MKDEKKLADIANGGSRRRLIAGMAMALGGLTLAVRNTWARPADEISRSEEAIHQEPVIKAKRKQVYEVLTNTEQFGKLTGFAAGMPGNPSLGTKKTEISREVGGTFTLFGGHIIGRHLELIPNERIVQAWRVVDWAPGHYSIAKFELVEHGAGTRIVFDHTGFPKGQAEHLASGWTEHYFGPMEKYFG